VWGRRRQPGRGRSASHAVSTGGEPEPPRIQPRRPGTEVRTGHRGRGGARPGPAAPGPARYRDQARPDRSIQRIDATGKLVTPGLIDLHTHICPHIGIGLPADELVPITCTTTAVSTGDAGWHTWGVFRHLALPSSRTRLFAFVHIASIGLAGGL